MLDPELSRRGVAHQDAERDVVRGGRLGDGVDGLDKARVVELCRDAQGLREVKVPDPDDVDAGNGDDRGDVLHALHRLDLHDHEVLAVRRFHLVRHAAGPEVVVRHAEPGAPPTLWIVFA